MSPVVILAFLFRLCFSYHLACLVTFVCIVGQILWVIESEVFSVNLARCLPMLDGFVPITTEGFKSL